MGTSSTDIFFDIGQCNSTGSSRQINVMLWSHSITSCWTNSSVSLPSIVSITFNIIIIEYRCSAVSFVFGKLRRWSRGPSCQRFIFEILYRPWRPLGLREVEAPTSSDIGSRMAARLSTLRAGRFLPLGIFLVHPRAVARLERIGKLKKSISSGTRTGDLTACSIVPQPTTLPHVPLLYLNSARQTIE
jgi:hypothetical protein